MALSRRLKRITIAFLGGLSILAIALVVLDYRMRTHGWPAQMAGRVVGGLRAAGFHVTIDEIRGGLQDHITVSGVALADGERPEWTLLSVQEVTIHSHLLAFLRGEPDVRKIGIRGADILLPVPVADDPTPLVIALEHVNGEIHPGPQRLEIDLRGKFHGIPTRIRGALPAPGAADSEARTPISVVGLLPPLTPAASTTARRLLEFCRFARKGRDASFEVQVDWAGEARHANRIRIAGGFAGVLYNGLMLERLSVAADVGEKGNADLRIHAFLDNNESLQAELTLATGPSPTIAGTLAFSGYPRKLLRATAPDFLATLPSLPRFRGPPPELRAVLRESPLMTPSQWRADVAIEARKVQVVNAAIPRVEATLRYGDGKATLQDLTLRIAPDVDIRGTGICHLNTLDTTLALTVDGTPMSLLQFSDHPRFHQEWHNIFDPIGLRGRIRPHFELDLFYSPALPNVGLLLDGSFAVYGASYNGVPAERATGRVFLDAGDDHAIISDLDFYSGGKRISGTLATERNDDGVPWLGFEVDSHIPASDFMRFIRPEFHDFLSRYGIAFETEPHMRGSGRVQVRRPWPFHFAATVDAPQATVHGMDFRKVTGAFRYNRADDVLRFTNMAAESMSSQGWKLRELSGTNVTIANRVVNAGGTVAHAEGHGWRAERIAADLTVDGPKVAVSGTAGQIGRDRWRWENVVSNTIWEAGKLDSPNTRAGSGSHAQWQFGPMAGNWTYDGNHITFEGAVTQLGLSEICTVGRLQGSGRVDDDGLTGTAALRDFRYLPTLAAGTEAQVEFLSRGAGMEFAATTPALTVGDYQLENIRAEATRNPNGLLAGTCSIQRANWRDTARATVIGAAYRHADGISRVSFTAEQAEGKQWQATALTGNGRYDPGLLLCRLDAESLTYQRFPLRKAGANVFFSDQAITVSNASANLHDGNITGDFSMQTGTGTGKLKVIGHRIGFEPLVAAVGEARKGDIGGKLDCAFDVGFIHDPEGTQLNGHGTARVYEGYLWSVPILYDFMSILDRVIPASDLAKITELRSRLRFKGDHLLVEELATNGTLVALTGGGTYRWDSQAVDMRIRAEPLRNLFLWKRLPFVSQLVQQPLNVLLERRLTGTVNNPKWETVSMFKGLFGKAPDNE